MKSFCRSKFMICLNVSVIMSMFQSILLYFNYRFPKDLSRRNIWLEFISSEVRIGSLQVEHIYLCSEHFEAESFYVDAIGKIHLKKDAIPARKITYAERVCKNTHLLATVF